MTVVVDATMVVAALIDSGPVGTWAEGYLEANDLAAPHHMPVEVGNVLRRASLAGSISDDSASLAHLDLLSLPVTLFPYSPFAPRIWQLRQTVTSYDAWYVSLAESLDAPLATLDERLSRAPGCTCTFLTPDLP